MDDTFQRFKRKTKEKFNLKFYFREFKEQMTICLKNKQNDPNYVYPKYERISHLDIGLQYLKEINGSCSDTLET